MEELNQKCENIDSKINDKSLELVLLLKEKCFTITSCESCTGGLFASAITSVSGSSEVFNGGLITYSNVMKNKLAKVSIDTLEKYGAVSSECVYEMSKNTREILTADISIAISGIAGPNGGSYEKPVGLVYIGLATDKEVNCFKNIFFGCRDSIRKKSVLFSLKLVLGYLKN